MRRIVRIVELNPLRLRQCKKFSSQQSGGHFSHFHSRHSHYYNALLKKFTFLVHPDYFFSLKDIQKVNNQNLQFLNEILSTPDVVVPIPPSMRTLVFYIKPMGSWMTGPRKVKISLPRLQESLVEVLDAVGVELPPLPPDLPTSKSSTPDSSFSSSSSGYAHYDMSRYYSPINSDSIRLVKFLQSIPDRLDIIAMKREQYATLQSHIHAFTKLTGIKNVEFWNSWSPLNNCLLLQKLMEEVNHRGIDAVTRGIAAISSTNHSPLSTFVLVIHNDPVRNMYPVDFWEGRVYLDCTSSKGGEQLEEIIRTVAILHAKVRSPSSSSSASNQSPPPDLVSLSLMTAEEQAEVVRGVEMGLARFLSPLTVNDVKVSLKRGFTCSLRGYLHLIIALRTATSTVTSPLSLGSSSSSSAAGRSSVPSIHSSEEEVVVEVEEGHGSRLLSWGGYRVDPSLSAQDILALIQETFTQSREFHSAHGKGRIEREEMERELKGKLRLGSIGRGLGVGEDEYMVFLKNVRAYLSNRQRGNRGIWRYLEGTELHHGVGLRWWLCTVRKATVGGVSAA
eukprot:gene25246-30487_t